MEKPEDVDAMQDFGDEGALVRGMPCLVTGGLAEATPICEDGGRFDIVPLSALMRQYLADVGVSGFRAEFGLDLRAEADRIALLHEPPLGVRGLAQRLDLGVRVDSLLSEAAAVVAAGCVSDEDRRRLLAEHAELAARPDLDREIDDYERAALSGWTARYLERLTGIGIRHIRRSKKEGPGAAAGLAAVLGIAEDMAATCCEQAGRPS